MVEVQAVRRVQQRRRLLNGEAQVRGADFRELTGGSQRAERKWRSCLRAKFKHLGCNASGP